MATPEDFELRVQKVLQHFLVIFFKKKRVAVAHRKKFIGKASGHEHEIDLSFELEFAETRILVVVECKQYGRNVGISDIMEFSARITDIGAHKGILATTEGFQEGAVKFAESRGIALALLRVGRWHLVCRGPCRSERSAWKALSRFPRLRHFIETLDPDTIASKIMYFYFPEWARKDWESKELFELTGRVQSTADGIQLRFSPVSLEDFAETTDIPNHNGEFGMGLTRFDGHLGEAGR